MSVALVPRNSVSDLSPLKTARNGSDTISIAEIASDLNMLAGKRGKVLFTKSMHTGGSTGNTALTQSMYGSFYTGAAGRAVDGSSRLLVRVVVHMILMPADDTVNTLDPQLYWSTQEWTTGSPGATVNHPTVRIGRRLAGGTTIVPDHLLLAVQEWDLLANSKYDLWLNKDDRGRLLSVAVFEKPQDQIYLVESAPLTDPCVSPKTVNPRMPITSLTIQDLQDTAYDIWKHYGPTIGHWCAADSGGELANTNTSYRNIWDTTVTAYSADSPGMWHAPRHRALLNDTNGVPVFVRVRAKDSGSAGSIAIVTDAPSGGTLGTITVNSAAYAYYETTVYMKNANSTQKLDFHSKTTGVNTVTVQQVSCMEYVP